MTDEEDAGVEDASSSSLDDASDGDIQLAEMSGSSVDAAGKSLICIVVYIHARVPMHMHTQTHTRIHTHTHHLTSHPVLCNMCNTNSKHKFSFKNNNYNVHLSCAHQCPECSHDTY